MLKILEVSNWDVSNLTDASFAFYNCSSLQSLNAVGWNIQNITNLTHLFYGCASLTTLNLQNWNSIKVTNIANAFRHCNNLTYLNVSNAEHLLNIYDNSVAELKSQFCIYNSFKFTQSLNA